LNQKACATDARARDIAARKWKRARAASQQPVALQERAPLPLGTKLDLSPRCT
jgi:hypothetical protein